MRSAHRKFARLSILLPAGLGLVSSLYLMHAFKLKMGTLFLPEEGFVPVVFGTLLFIGSCSLVVIENIKTNKMVACSSRIGRQEVKSVLLFCTILLGYTILIPILGFYPSTAFFYVLSARMMAAKWRIALIFGVSASVVSYLVFEVWLYVPLPRSMFF